MSVPFGQNLKRFESFGRHDLARSDLRKSDCDIFGKEQVVPRELIQCREVRVTQSFTLSLLPSGPGEIR